MIERALIGIGRQFGKPRGWERVVRSFFPPEECGGLRVRNVTTECGLVFPADPATYLGWQVFFFGTYEPEIRSLVSRILGPGGVAIDVGANVGWHTLLMAALVGETGRVLAFEPNPSVRRQLVDNIRANHLNRVSVHDCALSDKPGKMGFKAPDARDMESGNGHLVARSAAVDNCGDLLAVSSDTVDHVVNGAGLATLDFIKIDIEGWEWPALLGSKETLRRYRPIVIFEYIAEYLVRGGGTDRQISEFLSSLGYSVHLISRRVKALGKSWPGACNVLAIPSEKESSELGRALLHH